jgi:hypothetical protein
VVRDADRPQASLRRAGHQRSRREQPVGRGGMKVKIDQESAAGCRRVRRFAVRLAGRRR